MTRISRRRFIESGALTSVAVVAPALWFPSQSCAASPNERYTIGSIGCGSISHWDAGDIARFGDIVAFADVDDRHANEFKNNKHFCSKPDSAITTRDYRKILDRDDIQVVHIGTPDHWHVKIAIEALQAGKHVFCQKPLTLTIEEGQLIRKAVAKYSKAFQVGTQQRTMKKLFMTATAMIRKGLLGQIKKVTVGVGYGLDKNQTMPFETAPVPDYLDWNLWQGQTPNTPYIPQRCHRTYRYWHEYSGGTMTDWGAHHVDCAQWALGEDKVGHGPIEINGTNVSYNCPIDENGYPTRSDMYNTAADFDVIARFASGVEMHITCHGDNGILFEGTNGRIFVNRERLTGKPIEDGVHKQVTEEDLVALYNGKPIEGRMENFFRCIREGGLAVSDPISHTIAMDTCHLCVIAARLKTTFKWNPETQQSPDCPKANGFIHRDQRKGFELPTVE